MEVLLSVTMLRGLLDCVREAEKGLRLAVRLLVELLEPVALAAAEEATGEAEPRAVLLAAAELLLLLAAELLELLREEPEPPPLALLLLRVAELEGQED